MGPFAPGLRAFYLMRLHVHNAVFLGRSRQRVHFLSEGRFRKWLLLAGLFVIGFALKSIFQLPKIHRNMRGILPAIFTKKQLFVSILLATKFVVVVEFAICFFLVTGLVVLLVVSCRLVPFLDLSFHD